MLPAWTPQFSTAANRLKAKWVLVRLGFGGEGVAEGEEGGFGV